MYRKRNAFTLIELLVVISIIALLISILLPSLKKARLQSKRTVTLAHLRGIGVGMGTYANDNRDKFPVVGQSGGKAHLSLGLLGRDQDFQAKLFINPNTTDAPAARQTPVRHFVLAELDGQAVTEDISVTTANVERIRWHCSYSYDSDIKPTRIRRMMAYLGDRADYKSGRTISANWKGEGMCLLWTDQHAEFHRRRSLPGQSDPNIYHHNEFEGEGSQEIVDGIVVSKNTLDTHLRFFSEEEDDVLLPD